MEGEKLTFILDGQEIVVRRLIDDLFLPVIMEHSRNIQGIIEAAKKVYAALPPAAKETPWIIGSTDIDIAGEARASSTSHTEGLAFDMSPTAWSEVGTDLIPENRQMMGLAWNIASLALVAPAAKEAPFVVEGDHLHCMVSGDPSGDTVYAVPTTSPWYPSAEVLVNCPETKELFHSLFVYSQFTYRPATREEYNKFLAMVTV
jgi:hypothetical protein